METYHAPSLARLGVSARFVQENQSVSKKGVLRGLHLQRRHPQGKLVRVLAGEVFDVAVDLRRASPTYGAWYGITLSAENRRQLYLPPGFAHGFLVLSGTKIARSTTPSMLSSFVSFRNKLFEKGIIGQDYTFAADYMFTSPSTAASSIPRNTVLTLKPAMLPAKCAF